MISINITTTDSRLDLCSATIWSIIHQDVLPERINIWISREPYMADNGILSLPLWFYEINKIKDIVRIHYVENIGPYRKIIPALRRADHNDILIYADDDVIYAPGWYGSLLSTFFKFNEKYIVATRVRVKKRNFLGRLQSYNMFNVCNHDILLNSGYIVTGVGGCILKKTLINEKFLLLNDFTDIVPRTDDIWLSKIYELSSSSVFCNASSLKYIQEITHSNNALNQSNNLMSSGSVINKLLMKIRNRVFGYFGAVLSNNDIAIRKTDDFFKDK